MHNSSPRHLLVRIIIITSEYSIGDDDICVQLFMQNYKLACMDVVK